MKFTIECEMKDRWVPYLAVRNQYLIRMMIIFMMQVNYKQREELSEILREVQEEFLGQTLDEVTMRNLKIRTIDILRSFCFKDQFEVIVTGDRKTKTMDISIIEIPKKIDLEFVVEDKENKHVSINK